MQVQDAKWSVACVSGVGVSRQHTRYGKTLKKALTVGDVLAVAVMSGLVRNHHLEAHRVAAANAKTNAEIAGLELITQQQLEERHGLKITLIAVTAAGGIVDFRYQVTDTTKVGLFLLNPDNSPVLMAMDSGLKLSGTRMSRH
jgi:hypothetical protein